jgi:nucleotide-binding universal stress UspA family protein
MRRILVPTDFSQVANNALKYAVEIAGDFKSELYLYHVYHIHKVDYHPYLPEDEQPFKKQVERQMELTKLKFEEDITRKGLSVRSIVDQDSIFFLFKDKVKNLGIDLVVMGSKGASGLERVVFGSVAANVMEIAKIPVLVVPPGYTFRQMEHIVLAIDRRAVKPEVLSPVRKLAQKYGAKVTVLNVKRDPDKQSQPIADLFLDGVETTYHEAPLSKSINETINKFIQEEGCDLLCMIRREKGFLETVFQKSITKAQVHNSRGPLLVLPDV